jgi:hypothetical protein
LIIASMPATRMARPKTIEHVEKCRSGGSLVAAKDAVRAPDPSSISFGSAVR